MKHKLNHKQCSSMLVIAMGTDMMSSRTTKRGVHLAGSLALMPHAYVAVRGETSTEKWAANVTPQVCVAWKQQHVSQNMALLQLEGRAGQQRVRKRGADVTQAMDAGREIDNLLRVSP